MRKILMFLLVAAMGFALLSSCSKKEPTTGENNPSAQTGDETSASNEDGQSEDKPSDDSPETEPEKDDPSPAVPFERGEKKGRTYANKRLNFSFTPADEWDLADDIDLAELMDISVSEMDTLSLDTTEVIYDLYAYDTATRSDVVLCFEKIDKTESEYAAMTKEKITEANKGAKIGENFTATVAGKDYTAFRILAGEKNDPDRFSQTYYLHRLEDGTMAEIIVTVIDTSSEEVLSWFTAIN